MSARRTPVSPRIPTRITIADRTWTVQLADLIDEHECYGRMLGRRSLIEIDRTLEQQEAESTLVHESLHAMIHMTGLSGRLEHDVEERIVSTLEPALYSWLRANAPWWGR